MRKISRSGRYVVWSTLGLWLVGCGLEADLPSRNSGPAPMNSAVTLSGAGARDDADAGYGASSRITDIRTDDGSARAADAQSGGTDRGGAFNQGAGNAGGAASLVSGAAGAGGKVSQSTSKSASGGGSNGGASNAGTGNAAAGSGGSVTSAVSQPPTLWFSEYVEGSSSNKALELTALTRSSLEGCKVSAYFNGKTEPTVVASLSGTLEAGQVLTLCSSALKDKLADRCNQVGNLTFNGDDAVALSCNGTILDLIGEIGVDPGDAWGDEMNSTAEHTLRRKCTVRAGEPLSTGAFEPSLQWQAFPADSFDGLGTLGC